MDEVHIYRNFEADLKKIYDMLKVKIVFTSSTALSMYKSGYDLSRRVLLDELDIIGNLTRFIGLSGIDGVNYSSISKNLHITKYKSEQYVTFLEKAFILHRIFHIGSNVLKEPKIVMALPYRLLYKNFDEAICGLREDFFVETFKSLGKEIFYLKSTRGRKTPDYFIRDSQDIVFEIGGRGKGMSQFKGMDVKTKIVFCDGYEMTSIRRPLFLAGLINN